MDEEAERMSNCCEVPLTWFGIAKQGTVRLYEDKDHFNWLCPQCGKVCSASDKEEK